VGGTLFPWGTVPYPNRKGHASLRIPSLMRPSLDVASSTTVFRLPARQASLIAFTFSVDHLSCELDPETDSGLSGPTPSSLLGFTAGDGDGDGEVEDSFSSFIDVG